MCHQSRQLSAVIKDGFSALDRMQDRFFEVSKRPEVERFRLAFARRSGKAERIIIEAVAVNRVSLKQQGFSFFAAEEFVQRKRKPKLFMAYSL